MMVKPISPAPFSAAAARSNRAYLREYMELLAALNGEYTQMAGLGGGDLDWGHAPRVNVSVKPTALLPRPRPGISKDRSRASTTVWP